MYVITAFKVLYLHGRHASIVSKQKFTLFREVYLSRPILLEIDWGLILQLPLLLCKSPYESHSNDLQPSNILTDIVDVNAFDVVLIKQLLIIQLNL